MSSNISAKQVRKTKRAKFFDSVWSHVLVIVLAIIWLIPIIWVIANSFRAQPGLLSPTFFPTKWTFKNLIFLNFPPGSTVCGCGTLSKLPY